MQYQRQQWLSLSIEDGDNIRDNGTNWRLGHQSSCGRRNTHNDDEELEAAIWFDGVNSHKQHGGNDARASPPALATSCPIEPLTQRSSMGKSRQVQYRTISECY